VLAVGALLAAVGGLVTVWLVASADERVTVLVAARPWSAGQVLSAADVATTWVAVEPGVPVLPASARPDLPGQVATVSVPAGTLLWPGALAVDGPPATGESLVGLRLAPGRLPVGLQPGDRVRVVATLADGADPTAADPASVAALVLRLGEPDLDGYHMLDVIVAEEVAARLASWAASGRVAVVLDAGTSR
jgi:hypothetical protein